MATRVVSPSMDDAWKLARADVQQAQKRQKVAYTTVKPDHEFLKSAIEFLFLCLVLI